MNNPKLLEAIEELEAQRRTIDDAIMHLKKSYALLNGEDSRAAADSSASIAVATQSPRRSKHTDTVAQPSIVDLAMKAIEMIGRPLHITDIIQYIASMRNEMPSQGSVVSSLVREEERAKKANRMPRVIKTGPNTFDIPRNESKQLLMAS